MIQPRDFKKDCALCVGLGLMNTEDGYVRCSRCRGDGRRRADCARCHGTGRVFAYRPVLFGLLGSVEAVVKCEVCKGCGHE